MREHAGLEVNMYTGTMIDDLIKAVQHAETEAKPSVTQKQQQMIELQIFMAQMQHAQSMGHIRVGVA